ncbi:MAG: GHKL domain-containing protein [Lachnospiraceae bacterium]|nr:GHKL domain-containing protein [Lachnospiraceae bacterium]
MVLICGIFLKAIYSTNISTTITTTIISFGIGYLLYTLGAIFTSLIEVILPYPLLEEYHRIILTIIIGWIQLTLVVCLFRIRRLKYGLPFLSDAKYDDLSVSISIAILLAASFLGSSKETHFAYIILIFSILICGIILWLWWRNQMTKEYLKQLQKQEVAELNQVIKKQQEEIEVLKSQNKELAQIIHKDNKFLPAISLSVKEFYFSVAQNDDKASRISHTQKLLEQLEQFSQERAITVKSYESSHQKLPSTGIASLDMLFAYMQQKASCAGIHFDLCLWNPILPMTEHMIIEQDLTTLLGDLLENAIIATASSERKRIFVGMGMVDGVYSICVSDSGVSFPTHVLLHWGIKCVTTHADSGGSGIGLMSIFEICKCYHASFEIEEFNQNTLYSKQITIRFDGLKQHRVKLIDIDKVLQVSENPNFYTCIECV